MNWLNFSVSAYVIFSVFLGVYAGRNVKSSRDYVVAGRHLPFSIATATIISSWFGASSVLGSAGKFISDGLIGIVMDPFSAAVCLVAIALFYARRLYRCGTVTVGDFFHRHYGKQISILFCFFSAVTYIGWIAAQIQAFSLIVDVLSGGSIPHVACTMISSAVVVIYTMFGGMWSVALTDFLQTTIIISSMIFMSFLIFGKIPLSDILHHAQQADKINLFGNKTWPEMVGIISAFLTIPCGLIPQQDVFQRVNSAKTENVIVASSLTASVLYLLLGLCPIIFGYAATILAPEIAARYSSSDPQMVLPEFILHYTPFVAKVLFFGAIVSGLMGTASAGVLASSVVIAKNLITPIFNFPKNDRQLLTTIRSVSVAIGIFIVIFNIFSNQMILDVIMGAFSVSCVFIFIPFNVALFLPNRANEKVAYFSIFFALVFWIAGKITMDHVVVSTSVIGILGSLVGATIGIFVTKYDKKVIHEIPVLQ
ncbi:MULTISPECIES: sodium:solute symporter family protein [Candidatus Ichthyocystis]|uniref:Putative sodium:solute symporter n=1 Tax=Candidatus Ichthyocystis hellenicum TaxID=1561003 RepID=A0A0S4M2S7_9BURK|nr:MULTISPECIES: sodium:solute symporter family protein [Ichthyocystis]CUT17579.1 putative sodium:solute symporter [Candidatus Ichthyocystis hellenicum]